MIISQKYSFSCKKCFNLTKIFFWYFSIHLCEYGEKFIFILPPTKVPFFNKTKDNSWSQISNNFCNARMLFYCFRFPQKILIHFTLFFLCSLFMNTKWYVHHNKMSYLKLKSSSSAHHHFLFSLKFLYFQKTNISMHMYNFGIPHAPRLEFYWITFLYKQNRMHVFAFFSHLLPSSPTTDSVTPKSITICHSWLIYLRAPFRYRLHNKANMCLVPM